jgi:hypothetical protein
VIYVTDKDDYTRPAFYHANRLASLLESLRSLAAGKLPSELDLSEAPLLDEWVVAERAAPCLVGHVFGHPTIAASIVRTSQVWALAPDLGWARTHSRLYRLGQRDPYAARKRASAGRS